MAKAQLNENNVAIYCIVQVGQSDGLLTLVNRGCYAWSSCYEQTDNDVCHNSVHPLFYTVLGFLKVGFREISLDYYNKIFSCGYISTSGGIRVNTGECCVHLDNAITVTNRVLPVTRVWLVIIPTFL